MDIVDIIEKKKFGYELSKEEISFFIDGYVKDTICDYQASALLMAIRLNKMNDNETINLTKAMLDSGETIHYDTDKVVVDKHSTGGVGDKTSLVLVPLLATLGYAVSKMSGRGLGHTGGTLDKLESFEGLTVEKSVEDINKQLKEINCVIVGQSKNIVPADKKLYALRDVTSTIDSPSLIASSIMSKKLALGSDIILLDVKYGNGAFMKSVKEARILAKKMIAIGKGFDKKVICAITSMNQPLGENIGNALEVVEAVNTLKNNSDSNAELLNLCISLASEYLVIDKNISHKEANHLVKQQIENGNAYNKFLELLLWQGVKKENLNKLDISKKSCEVYKGNGYVKSICAIDIGNAAMNLGAGRLKKEDKIDLSVGIKLLKKVGDYIDNEPIAKIYYNKEENLEEVKNMIIKAYTLSETKVDKVKLIEEIIK